MQQSELAAFDLACIRAENEGCGVTFSYLPHLAGVGMAPCVVTFVGRRSAFFFRSAEKTFEEAAKQAYEKMKEELAS